MIIIYFNSTSRCDFDLKKTYICLLNPRVLLCSQKDISYFEMTNFVVHFKQTLFKIIESNLID